ncbi:GIY-YIG nuclease family protein [Trichocoleus desertorum]|uniref:GIY-YIG nuclease family protein n=1 Tax=Trichocoleus desertorum TaxID=1481672 RepID=UPI003D653C31
MLKSPFRVAGVYKITCQATGDTYVGASNNIGVRFREILSCTPNRKFRELRSRHPKDCFTIEVLQKCRLTEEFNDTERFWIQKLKPTLNVNSGGSRHFYGTTIQFGQIKKALNPKNSELCF